MISLLIIHLMCTTNMIQFINHSQNVVFNGDLNEQGLAFLHTLPARKTSSLDKYIYRFNLNDPK